MMNTIKVTSVPPLQWSQMCIQTVKKKNVFLINLKVIGVYFLSQYQVLSWKSYLRTGCNLPLKIMSKFQTGGAKEKGVVDNLFILRSLIGDTKRAVDNLL